MTAAVLVATILFVASLLKGIHVIGTGEYGANWLVASHWHAVLLIEGELLLGCWLLSGVWWPLARSLTIVLFGCFAVASLVNALLGVPTCGCFGSLHVHPLATLVLDVLVLKLLLAVDPTGRRRHSAWLVAGVGAAVLSAVPLVRAAPTHLPQDGVIPKHGGTIACDIATWVGCRLPLIEHIDCGDRLSRGDWVITLIKHDCKNCQDRAEAVETLSRNHEALRFALIEIPPFAASTEALISPRSDCVYGRLNDSVRWVMPTPQSLLVHNGNVVAVLDDEQISALLSSATDQSCKRNTTCY
jgi:hypothetical protein